MKVYLELPVESKGLQRVYDALVRYKPDRIQIVKTMYEADTIIIHVVGRYDSITRLTYELKKRHKRYAMIQYCLKSTQHPRPVDWLPLWKGAKVVWSYYDLDFLCLEDGISYWNFEFYYAPLGVDTSLFFETKQKKNYKVIASSSHALSEGVRECAFAVKRVGATMFHIGHELRRGNDIVCKSGLSDSELANYYSQSEFVCGLRRIEGFEFPAIEGLLCGARPILFDQPHYREWYDGHAVFIPETPREKVVDNLERIFRKGARSVTDKEKELVAKRFNWERIIKEFWSYI